MAAIGLTSLTHRHQSGLEARINEPVSAVCVGKPVELSLTARGGNEAYFVSWRVLGPDGEPVAQGFDVNTKGISYWRPKVTGAGLYTVQADVATAPPRDSAFNVMPSVSVERAVRAEYCR